ncbi:MAG: efflux system, outer rane lipoprotein NodT family, partial [Verrucomicrobiales bacterium]|nr:efflux system, outer rane lipoprotein NodT family [Verrucomicrobiales bacterium]
MFLIISMKSLSIRNYTVPRPRARALGLVTFTLLTGCNFAPKYSPPSVEAPRAFRELTTNNFPQVDGWKTAEPKDNALRGKWWEVFNDS